MFVDLLVLLILDAYHFFITWHWNITAYCFSRKAFLKPIGNNFPDVAAFLAWSGYSIWAPLCTTTPSVLGCEL